MQVRREDITQGAVIWQADGKNVRVVLSIDHGRVKYADAFFGFGECEKQSMVSWANWPLRRERNTKRRNALRNSDQR